MKHSLPFVSRLFIAVCALSLGLFVTLFTIQTTLLDRNNIKTWLSEGKAYETISTSVENAKTDLKTNLQGVQPELVAPAETAIDKVFSSSTLKTQAESAIDTIYDWLEGKTTTLPSIAIGNASRQSIIEQMSIELQSRISQLPICPSNVTVDLRQPVCRPEAMSSQQFATALVQTNLEGETLKMPPSNYPLLVSYLPGFIQTVPVLTTLLLFVGLITGLGAIASTRERPKALRNLASRLAASMIISVLIATLLILANNFLDSAILFTGSSDVLSALLAPLTDQALPAIGWRLLGNSSLVLLAAALLYGGSRTWERTVNMGTSNDPY